MTIIHPIAAMDDNARQEALGHLYPYGARYEEEGKGSAVAIAKIVRKEIKEATHKGLLPDMKISVRSSYNNMTFEVTSCDFEVLNQVRVVYERDNPHSGAYDIPYEFRNYHSVMARHVEAVITAIANQFNFDNSDSATDYFHVNFYLSFRFGYDLEKRDRAAILARCEGMDWEALAYPQERTVAATPSAPTPPHTIEAAPSSSAPLAITDYSDKSVIVKGETYAHKDRIKLAAPGCKPIWHKKAVGWIFPASRGDEVRAALADLLTTESPADLQEVADMTDTDMQSYIESFGDDRINQQFEDFNAALEYFKENPDAANEPLKPTAKAVDDIEVDRAVADAARRDRYAQRTEARRERLESAAERASTKAGERFSAARKAVSGIEPGQPILVGHHSEGRHRSDLRRHDAAMRAGIDAQNRAEELARRAESCGTGGISSDDPDAVAKLRQKLAELESSQARMVATNKAIRKGDDAALMAQGFSEKQIADLKAPDFCGRIGFPDYALTNNGSEIRRTKARIASLEAARNQPTVEKEVAGVRVVENVDANRLQMFFPGKPNDDIRAELKSAGFRWAPSEGAWQRHLTSAAKWAAELIIAKLDHDGGPDDDPDGNGGGKPADDGAEQSSSAAPSALAGTTKPIRLRAVAERLEARAKESLGRNRQTNTRRRAGMAAAAGEEARGDLAFARTILAVVDAQADGTAGKLSGLTSKAQAENFPRLLKNAVHRRCNAVGGGYAEYLRLDGRATDADLPYIEYPPAEWGGNHLRSMGIYTVADLREAAADWLRLSAPKAKECPIKTAERALVGMKIPGFVPTPADLAARMAALADIRPGMTVLEPSAGSGRLADAVRAIEPSADVLCIEPSDTLRKILEAKGHAIVDRDFLSFSAESAPDRVILNPPFEDAQDIEHVSKAFQVLAPGGRVVAIMSAGTSFRADKKSVAFREWLDAAGGTMETLPDGTFKESNCGVRAVLVVIDRPDRASAFQSIN